MAEKDMTHAMNAARGALDSIVTMMTRYNHIQGCDDGDDCTLTDREILEGVNTHYDGQTPTDEDREEYHDQEKLEMEISEDPLSLTVKSD